VTRRNDKPPHVDALRQRIEKAARERPEPRFGRRRARKTRPPADVRTVQQHFPFDPEVHE
jgi:hypothetical protein